MKSLFYFSLDVLLCGFRSPQTCELVDDVESEQIGPTEDELLKEVPFKL